MRTRRLLGVLMAGVFASVGCTSPPMPTPDASTDAERADTARSDTGVCVDMDNDGHPSAACGGDDCDDSNPRRNPGVREVCDANGVDDDCDPCTISEVVPGGIGGDGDADGDGFPSLGCFNVVTSGTTPTCAAPPSPDGGPSTPRVTTTATEVRGTDCDDRTRSRNPGVSEVCDAAELDENCNGSSNETCGCRTGTSRSCAMSGAMGRCAEGMQECIDGVWAMCPNTPRPDTTCDGVDDDCNGVLDDGLRRDCYRDQDSDSFAADGAAPMSQCAVRGTMGMLDCPAGFTSRAPAAGNVDCDDTIAATRPGAMEICNSVDDDCDGMRDENNPDGTGPTGSMMFYEDADRDTYGCNVRAACAMPAGYVSRGGDCMCDSAPMRNPSVADVCDNVDNNCDGMVDNGAGLNCGFAEGMRACPNTCGGGSIAVPGQATCLSCVLGRCEPSRPPGALATLVTLCPQRERNDATMVGSFSRPACAVGPVAGSACERAVTRVGSCVAMSYGGDGGFMLPQGRYFWTVTVRNTGTSTTQTATPELRVQRYPAGIGYVATTGPLTVAAFATATLRLDFVIQETAAERCVPLAFYLIAAGGQFNVISGDLQYYGP